MVRTMQIYTSDRPLKMRMRGCVKEHIVVYVPFAIEEKGIETVVSVRRTRDGAHRRQRLVSQMAKERETRRHIQHTGTPSTAEYCYATGTSSKDDRTDTDSSVPCRSFGNPKLHAWINLQSAVVASLPLTNYAMHLPSSISTHRNCKNDVKHSDTPNPITQSLLLCLGEVLVSRYILKTQMTIMLC